jgi:cytochrome P450
LASLFALAVHGWRARVSFGVKRGLPPGSLAIAPLDVWIDQRFHLNRMAAWGPIFKVSHFFRPMICVAGFDRGLRLLREHDDVRLRAPLSVFSRYLPCGFLRGMPPEQHKHYRRVIQSSMAPSVIAHWEPVLRQELRRMLDRVAAQGQLAYAPDYLSETVLQLLIAVSFGIGPDHADRQALLAEFRVLEKSAERRAVGWAPPDRRVLAALDWIQRRVLAAVDPGTPSFLGEIARTRPECLHDPEVTALFIFMAQAASTDLTGLFQWLLKQMTLHPEWAEKLRGSEGENLAACFVRETVRLQQSEHLYRRVLEDFEFEGYRVPKGWLLRILVWESHRTAPIEAPEEFRPERFLAGPLARETYLPFGSFRRSCIGEQLTYDLGRMLLRELATGFDIVDCDPGSVEFHGWHWTPGKRFRIRLQTRVPAVTKSAERYLLGRRSAH